MTAVREHSRNVGGKSVTVSEHDRSKARRLYAVRANFKDGIYAVDKLKNAFDWAKRMDCNNWTNNEVATKNGEDLSNADGSLAIVFGPDLKGLTKDEAEAVVARFENGERL